MNWEEIRRIERQRLKSIKVLTKDAMINIDQWLTILHDSLCYPKLFHVQHPITYFQEAKLWYGQEIKLKLIVIGFVFVEKRKNMLKTRGNIIVIDLSVIDYYHPSMR